MKPNKYETYLAAQPWIVLGYPMSDQEADANGGRSLINLECCICGTQEEHSYMLPPDNDPVWDNLKGRGLIESEVILKHFQLEHLHPDKQTSPMFQWAMPLRNVQAIPGGINLEQLRQRLEQELAKGS